MVSTMLPENSTFNNENITLFPLFYNITSTVIPNFTKKSTTTKSGTFESDLIIPLYVIIFLLSVVGNSLVLITLAQNRRMRTVTNVFLLNLVSIY